MDSDQDAHDAPGRPAIQGNQAYQIPLEQWHVSFIDDLLLKVPLRNRVVLDVGCGRGEVAREVMRRVGEVVAHGIDSDLCGLADVKAETSNRLTIHKMDVTNLAFPDAYFDAAYSLNVLEHINDLEGAYREVRRVLKPGGLLYLDASPIWTSYRGHHFNHWLSDYVDLIPPWGHLCLAKERLFEEIARKKGSAVAAEAMTYIFESEYLNRVSLSAHKKFVRESGFKIVELTEVRVFEFIEPPSAGYMQRVARLTGVTQDELTVDRLKLLLEKA
jgi:ubiquinone/menaquinone biosynthesis C-methylase UbiE